MKSMEKPLRILFTNNTLAQRAGTELYVRDLALALVRKGHHPVAYSKVIGEVTNELRQASIPVITDLNDLVEKPDIIHGHHHLEALSAMLHFPDSPAIFICHEWLGWIGRPPVFPTICRYIAVDDLCREKVITTPGIESSKVEVFYNFVDQSKITIKQSVAAKPKKALVFSNYIGEGRLLQAIRKACIDSGIESLDVIGSSIGNVVKEPGKVLQNYDIVFAKARCAQEAIACGCSVIILDTSGLGGLVTTENMERMRSFNFGYRLMQNKEAIYQDILSEIKKYNGDDSIAVSKWLRKEANFETAVDNFETLYKKIISEYSRAPFHPEALEVARYSHNNLEFLSQIIKQSQNRFNNLAKAKNEAETKIILQAEEINNLQTQLAQLEAETNNYGEEKKRVAPLLHQKLHSFLFGKNKS